MMPKQHIVILNGMPIGVISAKPAVLMNAEAEGQAIALKGRVPSQS